MTKDLNAVLDECIDRVNDGESIEECLARYPEHTAELEPLLRAVWDVNNTCSAIPRATAKITARQRLDAARVAPMSRLRKPGLLSGWTKVLVPAAIALALALIGFGLYGILTPGAAPVVAQPNFRLLLSDEENAIGDFTSLKVTITSVGMLRESEDGGWEVIDLEPSIVRDLTRLRGLNAQEIWSGVIPEGEYTQVFIYVQEATGTLKSGEVVDVIVPSGNLQISKPFTVTSDGPSVKFVHDVTAVAAGDEYVLLPQVDQSGADQEYHEVGEGELTLQIVSPEPPYDPVPPGEVTPGEDITVRVTFEGNPVPDALVTVDDADDDDDEDDALVSADDDDEDDEDNESSDADENENVVSYQTDENGLVTFTVPNGDELEIKARKGELKGELEIDFEGESEESELTSENEEENSQEEEDKSGNDLDEESENDELVSADDEENQNQLVLEVVAGEVSPGESITIHVTLEGNDVTDATVTVNGEELDEKTSATGLISFTVPDDDELEIKVVKDDLKGRLKIDLGS